MPRAKYDPELLRKVSEGDVALNTLALTTGTPGTRLERIWGNTQDVSCALCDLLLPHNQTTHQILLQARLRRLGRGYSQSKVRKAELAYRRATGKLMKMEKILQLEMVDKQPPTSAKVLAPIFGVHETTVCRWAKRLGLPLQGPEDWYAWSSKDKYS